MRFILVVLLLLQISFGKAQTNAKEIVISEGLSVIKLTDHVYQHISTLSTNDFGIVKCNGLIFISDDEAAIGDTPTSDEFSKQLIDWIAKNFPRVKIKAIIVNHFHGDCLAGLQAFHRAGIKSYAHELTATLLKAKNDTVNLPQHSFSNTLEIKIGNKKVINHYPGEAHTRDNIVTWIPSEHTIFGGCMVKSMNAGKGNLADANVQSWSNTIRKVKSLCPTAKLVVPGHGDAGGMELLDYTIKLFE
jgi:metallo-beta-lactamase class B